MDEYELIVGRIARVAIDDVTEGDGACRARAVRATLELAEEVALNSVSAFDVAMAVAACARLLAKNDGGA